MEKFRVLCFADGNCPRESEVLQQNYLPPFMEVGEQNVTYYLKPEHEQKSQLLQRLGSLATIHAAFSATALAREKIATDSEYYSYALLLDDKGGSFYIDVLDTLNSSHTLRCIGQDKPRQMRRLYAPKYENYDTPRIVNFNSFSCVCIPPDNPNSLIVIKNCYLPNIIQISDSENTNP